MAKWSKCPHCKGQTFEPDTRPRQWCTFCLPTRHESGLNIPARDLLPEWHRDRNQRPGYVGDARLVEYAIYTEELEKQKALAEEAN